MPSDGKALYAAYQEIDAKLVAKGAPATSKAWLRALRSFWLSGKIRMVVRKGRQVGASTIICPRVIAATTLFGEFTRTRGTRVTFGCSSSRQKEADERLYNIERTFADLGVKVKTRGDTLEIPSRGVLIQSFPSTAEVARGANAVGWWEDEMPVWRDGEGANPAAERDAAITPALVMHPNARLYSVGTPMSHTDFHALLVAAGDTPAQAVFEGPTWHWNPVLTEARCRQMQPDERIFRREFGAVPQAGTLSAFDADAVDRCFGRESEVANVAAAGEQILILDPSSGKKDAWTWGVAVWVKTHDGRELLCFQTVDGLEGRFWDRVSGDEIVDRLARLAREWRIQNIHGDQRESLMLKSAFQTRGFRYHVHDWTNPNKVASVERVRRWLQEGRLILPAHEKLRREMHAFDEVIRDGKFTFGARGSGHDDYVALLLTAAMADIDGHLRRRPTATQSRVTVGTWDALYGTYEVAQYLESKAPHITSGTYVPFDLK